MIRTGGAPEAAVVTAPAVKVARVMPSAVNAAALTAAKSAGGRATWRRMAVQSPLPTQPGNATASPAASGPGWRRH